MPFCNRGEGRLDRIGAGHVAGDRYGALADRIGDFPHFRLRAPQQDDLLALGRKALRQRTAEAAVGAGNRDDLSWHVVSLLDRSLGCAASMPQDAAYGESRRAYCASIASTKSEVKRVG
jgi:hypothetical protein